MRRFLLLAAALAGCQPAAVAEPDCPPTALSTPDFVQAPLTGTAAAPRALVMPSVEPARPLEQAPVTSADVWLADATGRPIPGLPAGRTDARGRFVIDRVPVGFSYQVVVGFEDRLGRVILLKALTRTTPQVIAVSVSTASTLLTEALTGGRRGLIGAYGEENYEKAIAILAPTLTNGNVPDLGRPEAVRTAVADYATANPTFGAYLTPLQADFAKNPPQVYFSP